MKLLWEIAISKRRAGRHGPDLPGSSRLSLCEMGISCHDPSRKALGPQGRWVNATKRLRLFQLTSIAATGCPFYYPPPVACAILILHYKSKLIIAKLNGGIKDIIEDLEGNEMANDQMSQLLVRNMKKDGRYEVKGLLETSRRILCLPELARLDADIPPWPDQRILSSLGGVGLGLGAGMGACVFSGMAEKGGGGGGERLPFKGWACRLCCK